MNTNGARAEFYTVQHEIVRLGTTVCRIRRQLFEILIVDRGEWVVRGIPAPILFVPLKHGEINHPEELQDIRIEQFVTVIVLLRDKEPQLSTGEVDGLLRQGTLLFTGPVG